MSKFMFSEVMYGKAETCEELYYNWIVKSQSWHEGNPFLVMTSSLFYSFTTFGKNQFLNVSGLQNHRLNLRDSRSSLQSFSRDVPLIATVIANVASCCAFSVLLINASLFGLSYTISPQSRCGLVDALYMVARVCLGSPLERFLRSTMPL